MGVTHEEAYLSDCVFYAVYMNEETHYYTAFDIVCLIELGVLGTLDYCFCFHKNQWQLIDSDPFVTEGLNPKFHKINESKLKDSLAGPPNFIPEAPNEKSVFSLVDKFIKHQSHLRVEDDKVSSVLSVEELSNKAQLKKTIHELEAKLLHFEKRDKEHQSYVNQLLKNRSQPSEQGIFGWEELIGEVFEVIDNPVWLLKKEGHQHGPYAFSYLYGLYKEGELSNKSLVKKEGDAVFNRISEIYEFNTKVFSRVENVEGKKMERLFVRRTDFRVPFYEVIEMSFGDIKWKGHCTNLSIGGCYIEFGSFPKELTLNAVVKLQLHSQLLNETIIVQGIVKNVQKDRISAIGCQFLDLSPEQKELISEYVESFLLQNSKGQAS